MITENLSTLKIHKLTQEQYDRELAAGRIDQSALYLTPDEVVEKEVFIVAAGLTPKAEIDAAIAEGKTLQAHVANAFFTSYYRALDDGYIFYFPDPGLMTMWFCYEDGWRNQTSYYSVDEHAWEELIGAWDDSTLETAKKYTDTHSGDRNNPHGVTAVQVGAPTVAEMNAGLNSKLNTSLKGAANGLAELDSSGKVPTSQLPSYVDDVIEGALSTFPATGETGKIYVDTTTNKTYRWSGSFYAEISASIALGETSSTAYRGDRGKTAYDHSQITTGNPHGTTKSDLGLGNVENKSSATIRGELTKANVTTALGYTPPTTDTTYSEATTSAAGLMSANDKSKLDGIATGANKITVDSALSSSSTNPVQNKVVNSALGSKAAASDLTSHTGNTTVHITAAERTAWNGKASTTAATTSAAGLMSAADKTKLNYTNVAYGTCSTAAATAAKAVTLSGNSQWSLTNGSIIMVSFTNSNTAENVTINVNGTGAYPIWYNNAEYTSTGTAYTGYAGRVTTYMFNGTHYVWIASSYDSNTTYTNVKLGHGYATCSTAAATTAKVGTLSNYTLTTGGIVAVKFTYAVPANATLNINSKGAKAIYYKGKAIVDGVIGAGEVATFIYNGSQYHLLSVDRNRFYTSLVPYGTEIDTSESATKDLNTAEFMKVGNYFCSSNAKAKYVSNLPKSSTAFMMQVYSPLSQTVDNESGTWVYRLRKLIFYTGEEYTQYCYTDGTGGNWKYGDWKKIATTADIETAIGSAIAASY